jgi:hypothetical protein
MVAIIAEEFYGVEKADGICQAPVIDSELTRGRCTTDARIMHHVFHVSSSVLMVPVAALSIDLHSVLPHTFFNVPICKQTDRPRGWGRHSNCPRYCSNSLSVPS